MDLKFKIILSVIIASLLLSMAYCIKIQHDTIKSLQVITESQQNQQKYLEYNITRIQSTLVSKEEFSNRLKDLQLDVASINKDLKSIGAKADGIIILQNKTLGTIKENQPSTSTDPITPTEDLSCKEEGCYKDKYNYFKFEQKLSLKDGNIPIGNVSFNATSPNPWGYNIFPRTYDASILLATDSSGKKTAYAKMSIKVDNQVYELPQTQVQYYEQLPSNQFNWWDPRIMAGFSTGISSQADLKYSMIPTLQLFLSSYGQLKSSPRVSILGLGFGYDLVDRTVPITITPFSYKLFDNIFQNLYIGPMFGTNFSGRGFAGLQLNLAL